MAQVLHITPEVQDRMTVSDFENACRYLEETGVVNQ